MYSLSDLWFDFTSPEDQQMLRSIEQKQGNGLSGKELIDNYINLGIVKSAIDISINHILPMQDMPCDLVSLIDELSLWLART